MKELKLSPLAISKILDIDLDFVIFKITGQKANMSQKWDLYQKELKAIRKKYKNELFELESIPNFCNSNAVSPQLQSICILREFIEQCNKYPIALMVKVSDCLECIRNIKFTDKYKYYDMFLSEENQRLILKKVADVHLHKLGETKIYNNFISSL